MGSLRFDSSVGTLIVFFLETGSLIKHETSGPHCSEDDNVVVVVIDYAVLQTRMFLRNVITYKNKTTKTGSHVSFLCTVLQVLIIFLQPIN